jgi:hypothetical protein
MTGPDRGLAKSPIARALSDRFAVLRRESSMFAPSRLWLYGSAIVATEAGVLVARALSGRWLFDPDGRPAMLDFVSYWVGAHFALARDAAGLFDYATFAAAQARLVDAAAGLHPYHHWVYPPMVMLLVAPLALLPYGAAFFAWASATLCVYLGSIYAILPRALAVLLALTPFAVLETVYLGQMAFLLTGLLGFVLVSIERRPYLAGLLLGLLIYKPQFGLIFPIVLVVAGQWRVIAGATASALLFAAAATVAFGFGAWRLFAVSIVAHNFANFSLDSSITPLMNTAYGAMVWMGAGPVAAWTTHLLFAVALTVLVCRVWLRPASHALKAAALAIGALGATPYMLNYDLAAVTVPAAFLVRDALRTGFLPGERLALLGCFVAPFLFMFVPIGALILFVLMALTLRRVQGFFAINCNSP